MQQSLVNAHKWSSLIIDYYRKYYSLYLPAYWGVASYTIYEEAKPECSPSLSFPLLHSWSYLWVYPLVNDYLLPDSELVWDFF